MREPILYRIVRPVISILFKLIYRPTIIGNSNIPSDGRIVLAGNHTNNLDCILLIASTKRIIHFLAKDELIKGLKRIIFINMGIIPVNRKIHDKKALNSAIEVLNEDKVIGIFPEGTFNRTNNLILPFKIGAVNMAHDTNSKIIPFIITGKYRIFRKGITIKFLESINIGNDLDKENNRLMEIVSNELR